MKFTVGQDVLIVRTGYGAAVRDPIPAKVVKVGRTLVTVASSLPYHGIESVYRMDTGWINNPYGGSRIVTAEQLAEEDRRAEAVRALRNVDIDVRGTRLTADQLSAILAIVTQDGAS